MRGGRPATRRASTEGLPPEDSELGVSLLASDVSLSVGSLTSADIPPCLYRLIFYHSRSKSCISLDPDFPLWHRRGRIRDGILPMRSPICYSSPKNPILIGSLSGSGVRGLAGILSIPNSGDYFVLWTYENWRDRICDYICDLVLGVPRKKTRLTLCAPRALPKNKGSILWDRVVFTAGGTRTKPWIILG